MPKPVIELSLKDLERHPVWRFVERLTSREMDETWVLPIRKRSIPLRAFSILTRARFVTPRACLLQGFMNVTTANRPVEILPGAIITESAYLVLPQVKRSVAKRKKYAWSIRDRESICAALGEREAAIFPIQYMLCTPIAGESFLRGGWIE